MLERYFAAIVFASVALAPELSAAEIIGVPDNSYLFVDWSPGGGGNFDLEGRDGNVRDYTNSSLSGSYTFTAATPNALAYYGTGFMSWSADFREGTLRAFLEADASGLTPAGFTQSNSNAIAIGLADRIYINEPIAPGQTVKATVTMTVDGNLQDSGSLANNSGILVQALTNASNGSFSTPSSTDCIRIVSTFPYDGSCQVGTGSFLLSTSTIGTAYSDHPYIDVVYQIIIQGVEVGNSVLANISNTAHLNISLQDGYTYRSESGFLFASAGGPTPVPEPASLAIFGSAVATLGLLRRRGHMKASV